MPTLTVRLTDTEAAALNDITRMKYKSRSHAVVAALRLLYTHHKLKSHVAKQIEAERRKHRHRDS